MGALQLRDKNSEMVYEHDEGTRKREGRYLTSPRGKGSHSSHLSCGLNFGLLRYGCTRPCPNDWASGGVLGPRDTERVGLRLRLRERAGTLLALPAWVGSGICTVTSLQRVSHLYSPRTAQPEFKLALFIKACAR